MLCYEMLRCLKKCGGAKAANALTQKSSECPRGVDSEVRGPKAAVQLPKLSPGLADASLRALSAAGISVGLRLNVESSEKDIYDGRYKGSPCVLCFPKDFTGRGSIDREVTVLRRLKGLKHVIDLYDYVEKPKPCAVLERVEPLGYDLTELINQHMNSRRPVPLNQVRCYILQLAQALEGLQAQSVVHRDLKTDNVLVGEGHILKIIDYGAATWPGSEVPLLENEYCAPEVNSNPHSSTIDLWGLGIIAFALCTATNPNTTEIIRATTSYSGLRGLMPGVHQNAVQLLEGLLVAEPERRRDTKWVKEWASFVEMPACVPVEAGALRRWPYHDQCPQTFAVQLPVSWGRDGSTIGDLALMEIGGVHVLLVDPYNEWVKVQMYDQIHDTVTIRYENLETGQRQTKPPRKPILDTVAVPNASTILQQQSWIYFGVNDSQVDDDAVKSVIAERLGLTEAHHKPLEALSRLESVDMIIPFMPEFFVFDFPAHCTNAILGPSHHATPEENALDLRRVFQINVAGVAHADNTVSWWPGASTVRDGLVRAGDRGLVMGVPEWEAAGLRVTVRAEDINDLMDVSRFRKRLSIDTESAWQKWKENAGLCSHRDA